MKVFMVIIFILSNGTEIYPTQKGWAPHEVESLEVCEQRKLAAEEYIEWAFLTGKMPSYYDGYKILCNVTGGDKDD